MSAPNDEDDELCHLLEGFIDYLAQFALLVVVMLGLWYKRVVEDPRRPVKIWGLDVSKQLVSGFGAHFCNMLIAAIIAVNLSHTSQCAWYFVVFVIDTMCGVSLTYLLHKCVLLLLSRQLSYRYSALSANEGERANKSWAEYIVQCGDYGDPPSLYPWIAQMAEWVAVTVIARCVCGTTIFALRHFFLIDIAKSIDALFAGHPHLLLFAVMVMCPVTMNLIQAWIQDNILKWKQRKKDNAARDSQVHTGTE